MSKSNALTKVGAVEVFTGINTLGILYLYYEIQKMGTELTKRIRDISLITQTINLNCNTVAQHFKLHLINHKNVLDVESETSSEESSVTENSEVTKEMLLSMIVKMDERIKILENASNPLVKND